MSDDVPRRPLDHHVEPLFAGLGVEEVGPARAPRRRTVVLTLLVALGGCALVLWWLV